MGDSSQRRSVLVTIFPEFYNWSLFHVILMYFPPSFDWFFFSHKTWCFVCLIEVHGSLWRSCSVFHCYISCLSHDCIQSLIGAFRFCIGCVTEIRGETPYRMVVTLLVNNILMGRDLGVAVSAINTDIKIRRGRNRECLFVHSDPVCRFHYN